MQAGGALPWEVTCRGVIDGISLVVHMTRHRGRRFVEETLRVKGYDAAANRWLTESVWRKHDEEQTIEHIHQGTAPWQKPWGPGERVLPANVDTGRSYAGGNSVHLAAVAQSRGYADVRWGTYRQIQARGGQVRKGDRGTRILSFQDHRKISVTDERGRPVRDNDVTPLVDPFIP